jgi:rhodanese-related sulfurtransferase
MQKVKLWAMVMVLGLLLAVPWSCAWGKEAPIVDPETLKSWLTDPQVIILDVRQPRDWQSSDKKIQGAVRQEPEEVKTWAASLPKDKKIVLYCA